MKTTTKQETKAKAEKALGLANALIAASVKLNRTFSTVPLVTPYVMAHYVNTATGEQGLSDLICQVLRDSGAVFSGRDIASKRQAVLAKCLTAGEIIEEVENRFRQGSKRYSNGSIYTFLCQIMSKARIVKGRIVPPVVGKLRQTSREDCRRNSSKPRLVWFVIKRA
jgi:hypothetical protein